MSKRTEAQLRALKALADRGGEGAIDKQGAVVAAGQRLRIDPATWLRLVSFGDVESAGDHRLRLTSSGRTVAGEVRL